MLLFSTFLENIFAFFRFFHYICELLITDDSYMAENDNEMQCRPNWFKRVFNFYRDGFRNMTVGKTLWVIILIKLFIFFIIIRWIFFPNFLASKSDDDEGKAQYVREQLVNNHPGDDTQQ